MSIVMLEIASILSGMMSGYDSTNAHWSKFFCFLVRSSSYHCYVAFYLEVKQDADIEKNILQCAQNIRRRHEERKGGGRKKRLQVTLWQWWSFCRWYCGKNKERNKNGKQKLRARKTCNFLDDSLEVNMFTWIFWNKSILKIIHQDYEQCSMGINGV